MPQNVLKKKNSKDITRDIYEGFSKIYNFKVA